jgi:hypothetical protein
MNPSTIKLHDKLLRLAKGMLKAWEEWIEEQKKELTHT